MAQGLRCHAIVIRCCSLCLLLTSAVIATTYQRYSTGKNGASCVGIGPLHHHQRFHADGPDTLAALRSELGRCSRVLMPTSEQQQPASTEQRARRLDASACRHRQEQRPVRRYYGIVELVDRPMWPHMAHLPCQTLLPASSEPHTSH